MSAPKTKAGTDVNIRKATTEDIEAIHALGENVSEFSVNNETVTFWPKELLRRVVQSEDVLIVVAEVQSVVGFLIVNYNRGLKKALIENIYVQPDMRGQGIGDKLLAKMFELLPPMGCEYVATLVPLDAQDAMRLYEGNGFSRGESFLWFDKSLSASFKKQTQ